MDNQTHTGSLDKNAERIASLSMVLVALVRALKNQPNIDTAKLEASLGEALLMEISGLPSAEKILKALIGVPPQATSARVGQDKPKKAAIDKAPATKKSPEPAKGAIPKKSPKRKSS